MKIQKSSDVTLLIIFLLTAIVSNVEGKCKPSGFVKGKRAPPGLCAHLDCCLPNKLYPTYHCSPPISAQTKAILRVTSFESEATGPLCDDKYYNDNMMVVAMSTGWFNNGELCGKTITVHGNGRSVKALVVDETDSTMGCDDENDYQPPSLNNAIDASRAVWKALGVPPREWGKLDITWSDS